MKVVFYGVSPDDSQSHQKFTDQFNLNFKLLCDPDKEVMKKYGAYGEKMMYGEKKIGVIRSSVWIGPDGTIKKHWARVADAALHPEQVLKYVQENLNK